MQSGKQAARRAPQHKGDKFGRRRVAALLDQLAGSGRGRRLVERLCEGGEAAPLIAAEIARSADFARLYKQARTLEIMPESGIEPVPALVGLAEFDDGLPFAAKFDRFFRPRLGRRGDGFAVIFDALNSLHPRPLIIETGCLRIPGNWEGDGQSSFMFDCLSRERGGTFVSIDIMPESIDTARAACSSATHLICNDSVAALHALSGIAKSPASLLYLDSFDLDREDPMPSAIHHLLELTAGRPLIAPGTIICIDDYGIGDPPGGKGLLVDRFLSRIPSEVLHAGYQKVWLLK